MQDGESGGPRRRAEIFSATLDMLGSVGFDSLTIEGVAQRSGVNKTTIYRWWSSKSELLRDALLHSHILRFELADTGSLRGDLTALAEQVQSLLDDEHRRTIVEAALVGAVRHQAMRDLVVSFLDDRFGRHRPVFERAVARGDLPADADPAPLVDAMAGALWMRVLVRRGEVADTYTRDLVGILMDGVTRAAERFGAPGR
ncbi:MULTISPECIES: TetR/AcrR family transcriptional regulator [Streptomyces]|uniref:TetR/AcrR family transcriptional regulator n=1 Tax=Streptomyces TaxID=1883 RepID=UPI0005634E4B|nr:TetR/AcrR family transcriptional regulator [Streptomyces sp. NRRL S-237]